MLNYAKKALVGTVAAGAMALATASPAQAQYRDHDRGPSTEEVIAGALIIGGIAAVIAAIDDDDDDYRYDGRDQRYRDQRYRDQRYRDQRYRDQRYRGDRARRLVEQCVRTAERDAQRAGFRDANVTEIRDVDRRRGGIDVRGRIIVEDYGDRRGRWGRYDRDYDRGSFTCRIRGGRVVDMDYDNIRGLR